MRQRTRGLERAALVLLLGGALAIGCSSAPRKAAGKAAAPTAPTVAPTAPAPIEPASPSTPPAIVIESVDIREGAPGMIVDLGASGPLVWTSYRKDTGELVIELPNTEPNADIGEQVPGEGIVTSLLVEKDGTGTRPLTRLTLATRSEVEHSLIADGNHLRVELVPTAGTEKAALTYEPLPEEPRAPVASAPAPEPVQAQVAAPAPSAAGTLDHPYVAPAPTGPVATRLTAVAVVDRDTVRLEGNGEFPYSTFRLQDPERFVVDLQGVINAANASTIAVDSDTVRRVRTAQFKPLPAPVSRVVFDLNGPAQLHIERLGSGLVVRFDGAGSLPVETAEAAPAPQRAPEPAPTRIAAVEPPPRPEPRAAVAEPAPAPRPEPPPRATSELIALNNHGAEPDDSPPPPPRTAKPTPPAPPAPPDALAEAAAKASDGPRPQVFTTKVFGARAIGGQQRVYYGDPVTMTLRDADVVETLRTFAAISKLSIVVQPGVRGSVTVELDNVPWDQALEQILRVNRLGYELEGTIMRIAPVSVLKEEAKEQQELAKAKSLQIPLRTVMRRLSYAGAQETATLLRAQGGLLSQRGSVIVDRRTSTLIIKELPDYIDTVIAVIDELDTPEPQVTIEARIVETTKRFSRSLGVRWDVGGEASPRLGNTTGLVFPNTVQGNGGVNLVTGASNGFLNLTLGNILDSFTLDLTLQAAENEGLIKILSAPKVTVLNHASAEIQSGLQIPIQTISNNTVTTQFINATLSLQVFPHVTAEGTILMDVNIKKREPQLAFAVVGATNAPIATKEARTSVVVRDGGTTVIGGIYKVSSDQGEDRVPGLANIPILGHIFKNKRRTDENEELLIFITPRVVNL